MAAIFITIAVLVDHAVTTSAATFHHQRSPAVLVPLVGCGALLLRYRRQLPNAGQIGAGMALTGGAANVACILVNPSGVSDYLTIQLSDILIAANIADVAMAAGLLLAVGSLLPVYANRLSTARRRLRRAGHPQ